MLTLIACALLTSPLVEKPLLLDFDMLQSRLNEERLRLLDPRPRADYDKGHIPGAVWVDVKAAEKLASSPGGFANESAWQAWIRPLGIGADTIVVVCDGNKQLDAARTWWLLSYCGVREGGLVNGNVGLWTAEKRPIATEVPQVPASSLRVSFRTERLADKKEVADALASKTADKIRVVDARSLAEYTGERAMSKKGGHVPGACRLEWSTLVDDKGRFLDAPALAKLAASAGLKQGEAVYTHCQGGGRASVNAFVLERLGHPTANYYLGWSEWGNAAETPVEKGSSAGK